MTTEVIIRSVEVMGVPNASDAEGILRQNLLDAGCSGDTVRRCMDLAGKQDRRELLQVLSRHRRELLDLVHQSEKRIDCLDYLVYQIEKQD